MIILFEQRKKTENLFDSKMKVKKEIKRWMTMT